MKLVGRNPLAFPDGFSPGIDYTHPAAKGIRFFSGIALTGNFISLTGGGAPGTIAGAPTSGLDGAIGPNTAFAASTANIQFSGFFTINDPSQTIACIFIMTSVAAGQKTMFSNTSTINTGYRLFVNGVTLEGGAGTTTMVFSQNLSANTPYFAAMSLRSGNSNAVITNLQTGVVRTSNIATAYTSVTPSGAVIVGNAPTAAASNFKIAAVMTSPAYLSAAQLLAWANDPWSFWYPQIADAELDEELTGFIPVGYLSEQAFQPPYPKRTYAALRGRTGFSYPSTSAAPAAVNLAWEIQSPQLRRPNLATYYATRGRSEFGVFVPILPMGWEVQPPQPPHPHPEQRAAGIMRGDDGIQSAMVRVLREGWEIQPPQPPFAPKPIRFGAVARGDDGTQAAMVKVLAQGWEVPSPQPPHPRPERAGAVAKGQDGIDLPMTVVAALSPFVFDQSQQFQRRLWQQAGAVMRGDDGIEAPKVNVFREGWEIQPPQPPHPRFERAGAVAMKDDGNEAVLAPPPALNVWWEAIYEQLPHPRPERSGLRGRSEFGVFVPILPWGWEIAPVQPPQPKPWRAGAILPKEDGNEGLYVAPAAPTVIWGWEAPQQHLPRLFLSRGEALEGLSQFAFSQLAPWWESWSDQLRFHRPAPMFMRGDDGLVAIAAAPPPLPNMAWPAPDAWPHPRPERVGAVMRGHDGIEAKIIVPQPYGWEVQPVQPPHFGRERGAPLIRGHDGVDAPLVLVPAPITFWPSPDVFPRMRPERAGAIARGDDGAYQRLISPFPEGWAIAPFQPPHFGRERASPLIRGDDGIQLPMPFVTPPFVETTPPLARVKIFTGGAIARGDDGLTTLVSFLPMGWEVQPVQPPTLRTWQRGAFLRGDEGIYGAIALGILPVGWEPVLHHIRWPRVQLGGALMRGDDGIYALYIPPTPTPSIPTIPAGTNTYLERNWLVSALPPPTLSGWRAYVLDSTVPIQTGLGLAPVGGGTHVVPVYTNEIPIWIIG